MHRQTALKCLTRAWVDDHDHTGGAVRQAEDINAVCGRNSIVVGGSTGLNSRVEAAARDAGPRKLLGCLGYGVGWRTECEDDGVSDGCGHGLWAKSVACSSNIDGDVSRKDGGDDSNGCCDETESCSGEHSEEVVVRERWVLRL
jgi:hypothetical protein